MSPVFTTACARRSSLWGIVAIEVSDGFGIVLRAIRLNHQTFHVNIIVTKYSALSKILTNDHKNKRKDKSKPDGMAI